MPDTPTQKTKPAWLAPLVIIIIIAAVLGWSTREKNAVDNPVVDLSIMTVGVFAFAAIFRWLGASLGAPGLASFFGAPAQTTTVTQ